MIRSAMMCVVGVSLVVPAMANQSCSRSLSSLRCHSVNVQRLPTGMYAQVDLQDSQVKNNVSNLASGTFFAKHVAFRGKVNLMSARAGFSFVTFDRDVIITAVTDSFIKTVFLKNLVLNSDKVVLDQTKVNGNLTIQASEPQKTASLNLTNHSDIHGNVVFRGQKGTVCLHIGSSVVGRLVNGQYRCSKRGASLS